MKQPIHISKTFQAIRQMPLEISMAQVREWVLQQPIAPPKRHWMDVVKGYLFSDN